jgi:DNA-binding NtrC family response regulator
MRFPTVLIVGEGPADRESLKRELVRRGIEVIATEDRQSALSFASAGSVDLVVTCSSNAGWDALQLAQEIRLISRDLPMILITRDSSEELAVRALKARVGDYFREPAVSSDIAASVSQLLLLSEEDRVARTDADNVRLRGDEYLVGESAAVRYIKSYIMKIAPVDSTVLITGETGTGKEIVAELIHRNSLRRNKGFVCINCAALPETLLESELFGHERGAFTGASSCFQGRLSLAEGGTVFLDEIGDLTSYGQAKLLRLVETKELQRVGATRPVVVDVRIIAATNVDLDQLASDGRFRTDLYFRLNVGRLHLPPLRDRKEDIAPLVRHYIDLLNSKLGRVVRGLSPEALAALMKYHWPGNVRELKNLIESLLVTVQGLTINLANLPDRFHARATAFGPRPTPVAEKEQLLSALISTNWNRTKAAEKLNWSRMTVHRKMKRYSLHSPTGGETEHQPSLAAHV